MSAGEELTLGHSLSNGACTLMLQDDGNLVLLDRNDIAVWASGTNGSGVTRATLQPDGNFVLYTSDNRPVWSTDTAGRSVDRICVQGDGNVVIYDIDEQPIWSTGTRTAESDRRTHTVGPGETLWVIAERYYGDGNRYRDIAEASGVADPDSVEVGEVLIIP
jgi:nucleoid-associated protein YgaU